MADGGGGGGSSSPSSDVDSGININNPLSRTPGGHLNLTLIGPSMNMYRQRDT